jgi:hypothetical protein
VIPPTVAMFGGFRSYARTRALAGPVRPGIRGIPRNQPPGVATTTPPATTRPGPRPTRSAPAEEPP